MRLIELSLRNFKGVHDFVFQPNGLDAAVYGDNGVGKSTLYDAWCWLLFDKDSSNRKDFEIKTLDLAGEATHGVDHEVEAVLDLGDEVLTLRKVYKEQWTKKRGSASAQFTGHTTDYYVDGVPVKKADYVAQVAQIADESVFRLLTDPLCFNTQLHWQDRRKLLLDVCGDVTDADVIAADPALSTLPKILGKRKLDDHRKVIAVRRVEINRGLDRIPVRIDEATRALPELPATTKAALESELTSLRAGRQAKEQERVRTESGGEIAEKQRRLTDIEAKMAAIEQRLNREAQDALREARAARDGARDRADEKARDVRQRDGEIKDAQADIDRLTKRMDAIRNEWYSVNDRQFEHHDADTCPSCGQALPADQVQAAHQKALADFNLSKAQQLEAKSAEGKRLNDECKVVQERLNALGRQHTAAESDAKRMDAEADAVAEAVKRAEAQPVAPEQDPEYHQLTTGKTLLSEGIATLRDGSQDALVALGAEVASFDARIADVQADLAMFDQRKRGDERIAALKAEERQLASEFEQLERELYLCDQFIRTKVEMLTDRINSKFELARFRLFEEQVNGGLKECCETLYQGVPYTSNLNTGARINVGLDIIDTLAEHYGFAPPVFIDGAESVTEILPTRGQQIKLVVSKPDKTLRVESAVKEAISVA